MIRKTLTTEAWSYISGTPSLLTAAKEFMQEYKGGQPWRHFVHTHHPLLAEEFRKQRDKQRVPESWTCCTPRGNSLLRVWFGEMNQKMRELRDY